MSSRKAVRCIRALQMLQKLKRIKDEEEPQKRKRFWVNPYLELRQQHDIEAHLLKDILWESGNDFHNFCRMDIHKFEEILGLVASKIERTDTVLRAAIHARVRLAVTLRYIATGDSYRSLEFLSHISRKTVSSFVPEVLQAIIDALEGQHLKEIKSTETQFQDYATITLEQVAQYYWEMHGLLQLEFCKIMQNFNESCQAPQAQIRGALHELNQKQTLVNQMRSTLETYKENIPSNIDLSEVTKKINNQLINMQFQVKITKINKNPFIFQKKGDFKREISNLYTIRYEDPVFSLNLNPIYDNMPQKSYASSANISIMDNSMAERVDYIENVSKMELSVADETKTNIKTKTKTQSQTNTQKVVAIMKEPNMAKRGGIIARVSHVISPTFFYIQKKETLTKLAALSKKYEAISSNEMLPQQIRAGTLYMGFQQHTNEWHRIIVMKETGKEFYKAFLVDIGSELKISRKDIRKIDEDYNDIEFAATPCGIFNLEAVGGGPHWPKKAKEMMWEIVHGHPIRVHKIEKNEHDIWNVDVFTTYGNKPFSIRDAFLYMGLAQEKPGLAKMPSNLKILQRAPIEQRLLKYNLNVGLTFKVKITHIENPTEFYAVREEHEEDKFNLCTELNKVYNDKTHKKSIIYLGYESMCCAIYFKNEWHRGCIEEIEEKGKIRVRFVDQGNTELLKWNHLCHLDEKFHENKEFAIRYSLDDIEPLRKNNYKWCKNSIEYFRSFAGNPDIWLCIQKISCNIPQVTLTAQKKKEELNCGTELVRSGLALSVGSSTQIEEFSPLITKKRAEEIARNLSATKDFQLGLDNSSKNEVPRTMVTISHIVSPGEFYVYLTSLDRGIHRFYMMLQEEAEKIAAEAGNNKRDWSLGDHCLVHTIPKSNSSSKNQQKNKTQNEYEWHRAIIVKISMQEIENKNKKVFSLFLRDIGNTIENISITQLYAINHVWDSASDSVSRCHVAGLAPTGHIDNFWSMSAKECFQKTVESYETLLATYMGGEKSNSMPIVLWGLTSESVDPLAPSLPRYSNINRILVTMGLAQLTQPLELNTRNGQFLEIEVAKNQFGLEEWFQKFSREAFIDAIERCAKISKINNDKALMETEEELFQHDGIEEFLNELDTKQTWNKVAPIAWLQCKKINKMIFCGYPTYVDNSATIYIHDSNDNNTLKLMCDKMTKAYKDAPYDTNGEYTLGQPCVVKYHLDGVFYRGIIKSYDDRSQEYLVRFVDYGNEELAKSNELRPFAPFPNLNSFASKFRVAGIRPKNDDKTYTLQTLDNMHNLVVDKMVSVRVIKQKETENNSIEMCSIRVGPRDFAEILISNRCVEAVKNYTSIEEYKRKMHRAFEDSVQQQRIDQIDEMENTVTETAGYEKNDSVDNENAEVEKCTNEQMEVMSFAEDFNYNVKEMQDNEDEDQEYDQQYPKTIYKTLSDFHGPLGFEYFDQVQPSAESDEDDEMLEAADSHDNAHLYDEPDAEVVILEESFINNYWQGLSAFSPGNDNDNKVDENDDEQELAIQWGHIKALQQKKEETSSEYEHFTPEDYSTSLSSVVDLEMITSPRLPGNVRSFRCSVSAVISSTVLHIYPYLEEFDKRDMRMKQLISQMVDNLPPLTTFTENTLCLACFTEDKQWYRAIIRAYNAETLEVNVLYIDFWNNETISIENLKICPLEVAKVPLRTLKVQLHGVKPSPRLRSRDIMQAINNVVYRREPFVRVLNVTRASKDKESSDLLFDSYSVQMFENENSTESIFQCLIDEKYLILTK